MARNKSEKFTACPDPRVIVHPNLGEHRLRVDEKKRESGESYWQVSVRNLTGPGYALEDRDCDDLDDAIKVYLEVPNRFWFLDTGWVGPVPAIYDPDISPEAAA